MEEKNKSSWAQQLKDIWEEIITKKQLENIQLKMDETNEKQEQLRVMIKEELTKMWNESEVPTLKLILEKLNLLLANIDKGKEKIGEEPKDKPESSKKIEIKKKEKKSLYTKAENKMLDELTKLRKEGKF